MESSLTLFSMAGCVAELGRWDLTNCLTHHLSLISHLESFWWGKLFPNELQTQRTRSKASTRAG